jgi:predicted neuraminidase
MQLLVTLCLLAQTAGGAGFETGAVIASDGARFHRNAIPQVARLGDGSLLVVWMSAPKEGSGPEHVFGAFSRDWGTTWSAPVPLIQDPVKEDGDPNILVDGHRVFVFSTRTATPNRIDRSWTMVVRSEDDGKTWSAPTEIPIPRQYVAGKQHNGIKLRDGTYMVGIAWDRWPEMGFNARTEGEMVLTTGVLLSRDGVKWTLHGAVTAFVDKITPFGTNGLCEPSLVELADGEVLMILRSGASHHYESRSRDGGVTWSDPVPSALTGHNTPSALLRLQQNPREIIAVWNNAPLIRNPLVTSVSGDGGKTWSTPRIVAQPERLQVSYPGITQNSDGTLVAVWQQARPDGGRDVRWARFTREWVLGQ